jgi:hypothetical protein
MATTYTLISSVTVGSGGAATIDFTSIPATYTDLLVKTSLRDDRNIGSGSNQQVTFNGSTSNYSSIRLQGTGGVGVSSGTGLTTSIDAIPLNQSTDTANVFTSAEYYISNYAGSQNKSVSIDAVTENNATLARQQFMAALWSDSAAITSLTINSLPTFVFLQHSTAYLYGIKN